MSDELAPDVWRSSLARQYSAALDHLAGAMADCPDALWEASLWKVSRTEPFMWPRAAQEAAQSRTEAAIQVFSAFWFLAYHCLFYVDFYLSGAVGDGFSTPLPFGGVYEHGMDPNGAKTLPYRVYTRAELERYLAHDRQKMTAVIEALTDVEAARPGTGWAHTGKPFAELLLITLRHIEEHAAQLRQFLSSV